MNGWLCRECGIIEADHAGPIYFCNNCGDKVPECETTHSQCAECLTEVDLLRNESCMECLGAVDEISVYECQVCGGLHEELIEATACCNQAGLEGHNPWD